MSDPRWRDARPSRPYGDEPGPRPSGRDTPGSDPRRRAGDGHRPEDDATRRSPAQPDLTQPVAPQPTFTPRSSEASRRVTNGPGNPRGRGTARRSRDSGGRLSRIWQGSLRGGLGVCVIIGSAVIGAIATILTRSQPGSVLALAVLAGTVAAALTVQPRTGRLIFPVPALSYLIAALVTGVVYDRSANKTEIAVGAAQWIANGFFVMVLATLLAIALTTVRWFMWRRDQRDPAPPDWSAQGPVTPGGHGARTAPRPQPGPPQYGGFADHGDRRGTGESWSPGTQPGTQPAQRPPGSGGTRGWDQRSGPRSDQSPVRPPDQRPGPRPGPRNFPGPYNFSSGA